MVNAVTITWQNNHSKAINMERLNREIAIRHSAAWGAGVAEVGKESVNYSVLSGGAHQTKKGGPRIESGAMIDSHFGKSTNNGGSVTVQAGFNRPPMWTKFQELGTRDRRVNSNASSDLSRSGGGSGIPAMLAIPQAIIDMDKAATDLGFTMLTNIARDWNTSV